MMAFILALQTIEGRIEFVGELPAVLEVGREHVVRVRVSNTGAEPLPGIPASEILSGRPTLFVGWAFTETAEEAFGFQGTVQLESPLAPGESRELALPVTPINPRHGVLRVQLWVSHYESGGLTGGPVGAPVSHEVEFPTTLRDASRPALLVALAICNAFFLGAMGLDRLLKRRSAVDENRPVA